MRREWAVEADHVSPDYVSPDELVDSGVEGGDSMQLLSAVKRSLTDEEATVQKQKLVRF